MRSDAAEIQKLRELHESMSAPDFNHRLNENNKKKRKRQEQQQLRIESNVSDKDKTLDMNVLSAVGDAINKITHDDTDDDDNSAINSEEDRENVVVSDNETAESDEEYGVGQSKSRNGKKKIDTT